VPGTTCYLSGHGVKNQLSESEYEFIERAGTQSLFFWGSKLDDSCTYANVSTTACDDHFTYTSPVGSYLPNAFGLYDTDGNVKSWTADCEHRSYTGAPEDGSAWTARTDESSFPYCSSAIVRGTSWKEGGVAFVRSAVRGREDRDLRDCDIGLRVARTE
jgi:formylglycine-generating enzyme required for sulfatase activity